MSGKVDSLPESFERLLAEDDGTYVYRGQSKGWPGPLIPSLFRHLIPSSESFEYTGSKRLRETGNFFVEELPQSVWIPRLSQSKLITYARRVSVARELRHTFGYPLSQMLSQQAGLWSEGLDVTRNIRVAAFFATHHYSNRQYVPVQEGIGIIYRFKVLRPSISKLSDLKKYDFYSCPSYLPTDSIVDLFDTCSDIRESFESILEYRNIRLRAIAADPQEARRERPFHLIKFPLMSRYYSRIIQQEAGLLMPDMLLTDFWSSLQVSAPASKSDQKGEVCIEDLSRRAGTTSYLFTHSPANDRFVNIDPDRVFPNQDVVCWLLGIWLSRILGCDTWLFRDDVFRCWDNHMDLIE